jgi:hypothetical protein
MLKTTIIAGAVTALLGLGAAAPASAQAFCTGPVGSAVCGAGIGGGLGAAVGGSSGAKTGAIIGGVIGLGSGLQQQQQQQYYYRQPQPQYYQPAPVYAAPRYCNYDACSYAYRSFRGSDCTFQPYNGPRQYCTK